MKKAGLLVFLIALLNGCAKENFLKLGSNDAVKAYFPDFSKGKTYRSNEGDTIILKQISRSNYFEQSQQTSTNPTYLGDYDYIEVERTNLTAGSDTPYFRINISLVTRYNGSLPTRSEDHLSFGLDEKNAMGTASMEFVYTDTLSCASERCAYQDTLKLQLKTFFDVYYHPRDFAIVPALYVNKNKGLVGFRTSENKIYELISN